MCARVCVTAWQQVHECYRESRVSVDSLRNVCDLCLHVHMNTHTHLLQLLLLGWDGAAGRSEERRAVVLWFRCPIWVWQLTLATTLGHRHLCGLLKCFTLSLEVQTDGVTRDDVTFSVILRLTVTLKPSTNRSHRQTCSISQSLELTEFGCWPETIKNRSLLKTDP